VATAVRGKNERVGFDGLVRLWQQAKEQWKLLDFCHPKEIPPRVARGFEVSITE